MKTSEKVIKIIRKCAIYLFAILSISSFIISACIPIISPESMRFQIISLAAFVVSTIIAVIIEDPSVVGRHIEAFILIACVWAYKHLKIDTDLTRAAYREGSKYTTYRGLYYRYISTYHEVQKSSNSKKTKDVTKR